MTDYTKLNDEEQVKLNAEYDDLGEAAMDDAILVTQSKCPALTANDWSEMYREQPFPALGAILEWSLRYGPKIELHKKQSGGQLWVVSPIDGRMMKVDWSYNAYIYVTHSDYLQAVVYRHHLIDQHEQDKLSEQFAQM